MSPDELLRDSDDLFDGESESESGESRGGRLEKG
jgi:hypothetical protein